MEIVQIHSQVHAQQLIQSLPEPSRSGERHSGGFNLTDASSVILPIGFLALWAIAILMIMGMPKAIRERKLQVRSPWQAPCRNCRFFSSNPYLRCAIHPLTALTKEATDCSDYQPTPSAAQETTTPPHQ